MAKFFHRHRETAFAVVAYGLVISLAMTITGIDLFITLLYLLVLAELYFTPTRLVLPRYVIGAVLLFLFAAFISAIANPNPLGNLGRLHEYFRLFVPFTLPFSLPHVNLRKLFITYLVMITIIGLYGLAQYFSGVDFFTKGGAKSVYHVYNVYRATGNFSTPLTYAGMLLISFSVFASLFLSSRGSMQWSSLWGSLISAQGIIVSQTRGYIVAMVVTVLTLQLQLKKRILLLVLLVEVVAIGVAGANFISNKGGPMVLHRLLSTSINTNTEKIRLRYWEAGITAIKENPILGVGTGNNRKILPYMKAIKEKYHDTKFPIVDNLHNIYLQILFEVGILGFLPYLAIWLGLIWWSIQCLRSSEISAPLERSILWANIGGMIGIMIAGLFENNFIDGEVQASMFVLIGFAIFIWQRKTEGLSSVPLESANTGTREPTTG